VQDIEVRNLEHMTEMPEVILKLRTQQGEYRGVIFGALASFDHGILIKETLNVPNLAVGGEVKDCGIDH
jgi:hypothetical protein